MINIKKIAPIFLSIVVVLVFYFSKLGLLKIFPVIANFSVFLLFFSALFKDETVKFKNEGYALNSKKSNILWVIFLFINLVVSIYTIWLVDIAWMLYNGVFVYFLILITSLCDYSLNKRI